MRIKIILISTLFIFASVSSLNAGIYSYDKDTTVIGELKTYKIKGRESLIEIARNFDLGYNEITSANPGLDPFIPGADKQIEIPSAWILPDCQPGIQPEGQPGSQTEEVICINLSEMRLYYFFRQDESRRVMTFPIGIGREGYDTPLGDYTIIEKTENPAWFVPESIRLENPQLPKIVPAGPDNPLGTHALRLSLGTVLIHGTNKPWGVGRRVSHGCIRLYPEDIPLLFQAVKKGTPVKIIRQPVKIGIRDSRIYVEVSRDAYKDNMSYMNEVLKILRRNHVLEKINNYKLRQAIREKKRIPIEISDCDSMHPLPFQ